ncbi:hypothetical protein PUP72_13575 [Pseudomonas synxantha]|uniref:hypothetical protein n=1 Tax=Pseudomonas synxantha TaxID=47883 RepID=UPI0023677E07|nr:hypothetical protein [Pseudomonas synxantha]WDG44980.1 hypothetical protein PUP72_13575 [Pseudomonas synxantha]
MSGEGHSNNRTARAKLGLVSHDNTGGYFIVECQECGVVYPSFQCGGGDAIADTGDYNDAICPHCGQESPEECSNVGLAWNTQQLRINELQLRLTAADERADVLETEVARLNRVKLSLKELADSRADNCSVYRQHLTVALALAEKVRDAGLGMQRKFLADLIDQLHQSGAALKPAEAGHDFHMIGTEKMPPMEYDEP